VSRVGTSIRKVRSSPEGVEEEPRELGRDFLKTVQLLLRPVHLKGKKTTRLDWRGVYPYKQERKSWEQGFFGRALARPGKKSNQALSRSVLQPACPEKVTILRGA